MKQFYINRSSQTLGPYSVSELKDLGITKNEYVWNEGWDTWKQANELPELSILFQQSTPPPFPGNNPANVQTTLVPARKRTSGWRWFSVSLAIALLLYLGYAIFLNNSENSYVLETHKSPEQLCQELLAQESQNPDSYLTGTMSMRSNR